MITEWNDLGKEIGSIKDDNEFGSDQLAEIAFERILGKEWVENSVDHIVSFKLGSELAMNCLRLIRSKAAALYAYDIYKSSSGEAASRAVWLIKHLAHPVSLAWVEEFLNDSNVMEWGIGVLDQLLWTGAIPIDEKVKSMLNVAEGKEQLKWQVQIIREFIEDQNIQSK
jgi:hypothetical protein